MKSKTTQQLIISIIMLGLTIGGAGYMVWTINQNGALLREQLETLNEQNRQEASLLRLQRLATETKDDREELASHFLLRESDSIAYLSDIETLAPSVGVTLETKDLRQVDEKDKTSWIQVSFALTGERDSLEQFIDLLEKTPYVSRIISVNLVARSAEYWQANVTIQVQLLGYDR